VEPAFVGDTAGAARAEISDAQSSSVQKLESDQSLRVIISVRVEKETDDSGATALPLAQKSI
jgi:hypothetical protein